MSDTGWLDEALRMPLAFAQVREDPRVDLAVVDRLERSGLCGLMIASGGCTAAVLAASGRFDRLHLVDANAAQLALTAFKLHLLRHETPARRRELLGHAPADRSGGNVAPPPEGFGPRDLVTRLGLDQAGRYELLFARLREVMAGKGLGDWPALLAPPGAAAGAVDPAGALGRAFGEAFDDVMAIDHLVALFGRGATQNAVVPFSRHFAARTRHALLSSSAKENPFLWQLLVGRFPPGRGYDWLDLPPSECLAEFISSCAPMGDVLAASPERHYDFIHLSNILDWQTEAEAAEMLRLTHRALKPGGLVIIRQLNSSLDLPALGPQLEWLGGEVDALHRRDRSFFYRKLHLGRRA